MMKGKKGVDYYVSVETASELCRILTDEKPLSGGDII